MDMDIPGVTAAAERDLAELRAALDEFAQRSARHPLRTSDEMLHLSTLEAALRRNLTPTRVHPWVILSVAVDMLGQRSSPEPFSIGGVS